MIFRVEIDKNSEESITAVIHKRTALIDEIEKLIMMDTVTDKIPGYLEDEIMMLDISEIECFYVESDKTFAVYADGKRYLIKKRLYELERILSGDFERINKSVIGNMRKVLRFKMHLSGAVDVIFKSGYEDYVSRRCFADLKRRYGL